MEAWKLLSDQGKSVGVLNMGSVSPLDKEAVLKAAECGPIITVEDHNIETGVGAMVAIVLIEGKKMVTLKRLGVKRYGNSGKPSDLYADQGLDAQAIAKTVVDVIG